jgi:hypothetical protein
MKYEVQGRSKTRTHFVHTVCDFFIRELNLDRSTYILNIFLEPNLVKTKHVNGVVVKIEDRHIIMCIDSRLSLQDTIQTLAHEMVHVKQIARGQMTFHRQRNGVNRMVWLGVKQKHYDNWESPWELEAYSRELILANKIFRILNDKKPVKTRNKSKKSPTKKKL